MKKLFLFGLSLLFLCSCQRPSGIETPTLFAPDDNSVIATAYPDFDWSDVDDVSYYQIQIDGISDFLTPDHDLTVYASEFTSIDSLADGDYWWRVRAWGCSGGS